MISLFGHTPKTRINTKTNPKKNINVLQKLIVYTFSSYECRSEEHTKIVNEVEACNHVVDLSKKDKLPELFNLALFSYLE